MLAKSLVLYYAFYIAKFFSVGYIFYRLGRKFKATNPFWHYLIPVWNYVILCRCTNTSSKYAVAYHVLYFLAVVAQLASEILKEPALINIWLALFVMCIMLEAEIFGQMAVRLKKDFWLYGFSGFAAYFPLIFLIIAKSQPETEVPKPPSRMPTKGEYPLY
ncbi:MAG: hypothetical protein N2491_07020 [Negativicutes bacterium]|nr:hypothetical protein [Negativicutes bacterium]